MSDSVRAGGPVSLLRHSSAPPGGAARSGMLTIFLALGASSAAPQAPPYTFSLDQTVPCPLAAQDYSISATVADVNASQALQAALAAIPTMLDEKLEQLSCPSTNVIVTQGGNVIYRSYRGSSRMHSQAPLSDDTGYKIASLTKTFSVVRPGQPAAALLLLVAHVVM